jgi:multisubunit Na+/H+ antiporter MnhC subunit
VAVLMTVQPSFFKGMFVAILLAVVMYAIVIGACVAALALAALIGGGS